jgi:hypothetical protein
MSGNDVFNSAMDLLAYSVDSGITRSALTYVNKVYADLHRIAHPNKEFKPLGQLVEDLDLPVHFVVSVAPLGVAELIALGRGDGELQQYFALDYDRAKAKLNVMDKVEHII